VGILVKLIVGPVVIAVGVHVQAVDQNVMAVTVAKTNVKMVVT
jgi:hypothetical protein